MGEQITLYSEPICIITIMDVIADFWTIIVRTIIVLLSFKFRLQLIKILKLLYLTVLTSCIIIPLWFVLKTLGPYMTPRKKFILTIKSVYLIISGIPWLKMNYIGEDDGYQGSQIFVSNHIGLIDSFVISAFWAKKWKFARVVHGMVDSHYLNIPFFGTIIKSLQPIPVHFNSREKTSGVEDRSKEEIKRLTEEYLKKGDSLLIFPEGTRNDNPEKINNIKYGAYNSSKNNNTPIKIMALYGLEKFWPRKDYPVYNTSVYVIQYDGNYIFKDENEYKEILSLKFSYSNIRYMFIKE